MILICNLAPAAPQVVATSVKLIDPVNKCRDEAPVDFGMQKHFLPYSFESPGKFVDLTTRPAKGSLGMTTRPNDICGGDGVVGVDRKIRPDWNWVSPIWTEKRAASVWPRACACSALPRWSTFLISGLDR